MAVPRQLKDRAPAPAGDAGAIFPGALSEAEWGTCCGALAQQMCASAGEAAALGAEEALGPAEGAEDYADVVARARAAAGVAPVVARGAPEQEEPELG